MYIQIQDTNFRLATPTAMKVAVGLKCLATTCDTLTVSALFGLGRSSVSKYFLHFISACFTKLVPELIKFPTQNEEFQRLADDFERMWGFPMAVAAIDGTHIPFNPPIELSTDFHNYKGWSSIMTLGVCDAKGQAIWIKSGMPGRMSDSGAFKQTQLYQRFFTNQILPQVHREIEETQVPFLVLGDSGFGLESWLQKPFTHHTQLSESQKIFNYRHSRARRSVENMFGRVKCRWRRLLRGVDVRYENAHKVISVAFALNNLCEKNTISFEPTAEEISENEELNRLYPQPTQASQKEYFSGILIRNALMNFFVNQDNPWTGC